MICPNCKKDNCVYNSSCIECQNPLIGDEVNMLDQIGEVWNNFLKLPSLHPDEQNEFRVLIHQLQDRMSFRIAKKLTKGDKVYL